MSAQLNSQLSATQQSMLDLALGCDLKVSDPGQHSVIRARHSGIKTQQGASEYIHEVENKIHSRRRTKLAKTAVAPTTVTVTSKIAKPVGTVPPPGGALAPVAFLVLLVLMVVAGWFAPKGWNLVLVTASLLLMLVALGKAITNEPLGVLINQRNLMSLGRFQMVVWTVVVLAAYLTFAIVRIKALATGLPNGDVVTDPLNIVIDWHLWALLGISTTSMVGAPLILSTKQDKTPDSGATQQAARMVNEAPQEIENNRQGTLYANAKISDARLTDLFQGDELTNTAQVDLAKVQMFYFTVIAAICFFVMVFDVLVVGKSDLGSLPILPDGFVAILGISHAGYLTSKSINHTKSQP
jgi:hypothetical protein